MHMGDIRSEMSILLADLRNRMRYAQNGWTPLIMAAGVGNLKVMKLLIEAGATIDQADNVRK